MNQINKNNYTKGNLLKYKDLFLKYYLTFLLIFTSGMIYGSYIYYKQMVVYLLINALIINKFKMLNFRSVILLIAISIILLCNFLISPQNNLDGYIALFIKMLSIALILNSINIKSLSKCYINIMAIIAFISIICFSIWVTNPSIITSNIPIIEVWGNPARITFFYSFPVYGLDRNFGPYREPGMYQIFLNIAMYLIIKYQSNKKRDLFKLLILFISIITTFSTAGIIICFMIIFRFLVLRNNMSTMRNNNKIVIIAVVLFICVIIAENKYGIVSNKLNTDNASFSDRSSEFSITYKILKDNFLLGIGFQNNDYILRYGNGITNGTNGILALYQQFGIIFATIIMCLYYNGVRKITNNIIDFTLLSAIMTISFSTEPTMFQPLFIILLFVKNYSEINNKIINNYEVYR